jgi:predicted XRE-type DNA-binding protein
MLSPAETESLINRAAKHGATLNKDERISWLSRGEAEKLCHLVASHVTDKELHMTTTSPSLYFEYEKSQLMTTNPMSFEEWKKAREAVEEKLTFPTAFHAIADSPEEAEEMALRSRLLIILRRRVNEYVPDFEFPSSVAPHIDDIRKGRLSKFSMQKLVALTFDLGIL